MTKLTTEHLARGCSIKGLLIMNDPFQDVFTIVKIFTRKKKQYAFVMLAGVVFKVSASKIIL